MRRVSNRSSTGLFRARFFIIVSLIVDRYFGRKLYPGQDKSDCQICAIPFFLITYKKKKEEQTNFDPLEK